MPSFNFICTECGDVVTDYDKGEKDRIPLCFICGGQMEILTDSSLIPRNTSVPVPKLLKEIKDKKVYGKI